MKWWLAFVLWHSLKIKYTIMSFTCGPIQCVHVHDYVVDSSVNAAFASWSLWKSKRRHAERPPPANTTWEMGKGLAYLQFYMSLIIFWVLPVIIFHFNKDALVNSSGFISSLGSFHLRTIYGRKKWTTHYLTEIGQLLNQHLLNYSLQLLLF